LRVEIVDLSDIGVIQFGKGKRFFAEPFPVVLIRQYFDG